MLGYMKKSLWIGYILALLVMVAWSPVVNAATTHGTAGLNHRVTQNGGNTASMTKHAANTAKGPLDGMKFSGQVGTQNQKEGFKRNIIFEHGMLQSSVEAKQGFHRIPYTATTEGNTTTFTATETNAKGEQVNWHGTITNGVMDAQVTVTPKNGTASTLWVKANESPMPTAAHH